MKNGNLKIKQQGMTLVEIMIALVLGIFLIAGVLQIFLGAKQSNRMLDNLSRMQENGRFAMDFISRDIREAGLIVCRKKPLPVLTVIADTDNSGVNNSDSITIEFSKADCPIPPALPTIIATIFSISESNNIPSLNRKVSEKKGANTTIVENGPLFEGIEKMQIWYGEDTDDDNTPNYYVSENNVVDMDKVVSVRVNLLVVSLDNNLSIAPVKYQFNGSESTPPTGDHRLRREFSSTIAIRNRLP